MQKKHLLSLKISQAKQPSLKTSQATHFPFFKKNPPLHTEQYIPSATYLIQQAHQYGGSGTMHKASIQNKEKGSGKLTNALTAVKR